jgi:pantoate--beta-alanine ligase
MDIVKTIAEVRERVSDQRRRGRRIGFVPTMGYLHRGHMSLVEISRKHSDYQVMSIFVNRMQFNDPKDYDSYPVDHERDFAMAGEAGVDCVFLPEHGEMYRDPFTYVDISTLTDTLCGATRPGHFRGVLTVVCKLFNIVLPDVSVFGQKDIQQCAVIQKMVSDLDMPVEIIAAPIVREEDGLAMSSRNKNLTPRGRKDALAIHRGLRRAEDMLKGGERDSAALIAEIERTIQEGKPDRIDYVSVVRYRDLAYADRIDGRSVIAVAAFFGAPRLIDNMIVEYDGGNVRCIY